MQKLLFVTHYSGLGGGETALLALAAALDPTGWEPHLLVPEDGQLAARWRAHGWHVHVRRWRGASVWFVPALWARLPIVGALARLIREEGIALVHSDYHTLPMALPAAGRAGVPCVWTCMGWWFRPKPWQRAFFRRPAAAFAHSEAIRRGFLGEPPFMSADRMRLLYPGVDTARFHPEVDGLRVRFQAGVGDGAPVVAMVGRFQQVKGHDVFLAMARQVALQVPTVRFLVAGENVHGVSADDVYKQRILAAHAADPLLRDRLTWLGFRDDVERVYAAADVVVCPSRFESFGVANVEAMACGKPVVTTNRGGPRETVVDGETGYLVAPDDPGALAARVISLLRDADVRARLGAAARERAVAMFSVTESARVFTQTIESVLS